jgi:4'-phosphopantetheinyl transferase
VQQGQGSIFNNRLTSMCIEEPKWEAFPDFSVKLSCAPVHLFRINVADCYPKIAACYSDVLSKQELDRALRFFHKKDRMSYLVRRFYRRKILSCFASSPAQTLVFSTAGNKKPVVDGLEFNVSHSAGYVVVAVSSFPIGVDLEHVNPSFDFTSIVASCFNNEERIFVSGESARFFALWTRKEAVLKATGEGLTDHLPQIGCMGYEVCRQGNVYQLKTLGFAKQYVLSLATMAPASDVKYWEI